MTLSRPLSPRSDLFIAVGLAGVSLLAYVNSLAPTLLTSDAAEFQFASYLLGIAHPTGYPLYLIIGWLWSHLLPVGDPAFRINLLSAVFAAVAIALLYGVILEVLRSTLQGVRTSLVRATAAVGTLALAFSRTFWSQAVRAEVYALNSLFVVAILLLLLSWSKAEPRSRRVLYVAALVYGLSLTHHRTMVLLLPAFALFIWLVDRSALTQLQSLWRILVLILVPQILYLYIPWRAPATPYLHLELASDHVLDLYDNTLPGFLDFVMGQMFRGELGYQAPIAERVAMAAGFLLKQFGVAGLFLGLLGAVKLGLQRWKVLILLGLPYVAVVVFNLFYFIGDIQELFTPTYVIFAISISVGVGWLLGATGRLGTRWARARGPVSYAVAALFALIPLGLLWNNYQRVDKSGDYHARQWAEDILWQPLPEGAILISNDRNEITPLIYLQYVEGVRSDVVSMFPLMLPGDEYCNVVRVIDTVMDVERPIYLVKPMPGLEIKYQIEPVGPLVEVKGTAITGDPQYPTDLALDDRIKLIGYDLEPDTASPGEIWRVVLHWQVAESLEEDYHSYVHLAEEGGKVVAQSDHQPGGGYYPASLWQPEETLLDEHTVTIPPDSAGRSLRLLAGMYAYPSLEPLGAPQVLGDIRATDQSITGWAALSDLRLQFSRIVTVGMAPPARATPSRAAVSPIGAH